MVDYEEVKLIAQAKNDFAAFAESDIVDQSQFGEDGFICKDFHKEWVEAVENNERVVITAATGLGKSETLAILYPLWKIFFADEPFSALIVSTSMDQSKKILRRLKTHLENSEYLQDYIPDDRSNRWSAKSIDLEDPEGFMHSIECRPYNPNIKGDHVKYVLCDEMAEYDDHDVFSSAVKTRVAAKGGTLVGISTPVHENDLRAKLSEGVQNPECQECYGLMHEDRELSEERDDDKPVYKCEDCANTLVDPEIDERLSEKGYWNDKFTVLDDAGEPTFPEQFGMRKIKRLRREDPEAFKREYLCEPISSEGGLFDSEDIMECFDKSESFRLKAKEDSQYYLGVDLAASKRGDYSVYAVVEVFPDSNKKVLRYMERVQGMSLPAQTERLKNLHETFEFSKILVDETRYKSVLNGLREAGLPADGQSFESSARSELLMKMKTDIEEGNVVLPRSTEYIDSTRELTDEVFHELDGFGVVTGDSGHVRYESTTDHDDTVMALAMALKAVTGTKQGIVHMGSSRVGASSSSQGF